MYTTLNNQASEQAPGLALSGRVSTAGSHPWLSRYAGIHFRPDGGDDGGTGDNGGNEGGEGTGGDSGEGDADGKGGKQDEKVSLSQAQLDRIIDQRIAAAKRGWEKDQGSKKADDGKGKDKSSQAKGGVDGDKTAIPRSEWESLKSDLEKQHADELETYKQTVSSLLQEKKKAAVASSLANLNPFNAEQVIMLAGSVVDFDEDGVVVVKGANGQPRYGKSGEYLTVNEYLGEFKAANPHLFKAEANGGAGSSTQSQSTKGGKAQYASNVDRLAAGLKKLNG